VHHDTGDDSRSTNKIILKDVSTECDLVLHGELLEVVHEHLQRNIIRVDDIRAGVRVGVVCSRRVELGEQEARLAPVLVAVHQAWDREALRDDSICVRLGPQQQLRERRVLRLQFNPMGISLRFQPAPYNQRGFNRFQ
jgi:hypothetical protein